MMNIQEKQACFSQWLTRLLFFYISFIVKVFIWKKKQKLHELKFDAKNNWIKCETRYLMMRLGTKEISLIETNAMLMTVVLGG